MPTGHTLCLRTEGIRHPELLPTCVWVWKIPVSVVWVRVVSFRYRQGAERGGGGGGAGMGGGYFQGGDKDFGL